MSIKGKITSLYTDKTMSEALLPRTNTKAVTDDKGINLNAILDQVAYVDTKNSEAAVAPLNADTLAGFPADNYASKTYVSNEIAKAQLGGGSGEGDIDLSGYATKDDLNNKLSIDGTNSMTADLSMGNHKITSLRTPIEENDAVTKAYADDLFGGVFNKVDYVGDFRNAPGGTVFTRAAEGGCSNYPSDAQYGYLTTYIADASRLLIYSEHDTKKIYTCNNVNGWNDWTRIDGIDKAPVGFGLGGDGKFITDCNGQNASGFYEWDAGCANSPWDWGTMLVLGRHSGCTQVAFGEDGAARDEIAIRSISTGTSSWKRLTMIDVVWENENYTSSFAAQTAPCDLSRYDWIGIVCTFDVNGVRRLPLFMCQANTITGGYISGINPEDNTIVGRTVASANSSGVTFADAYKNGNTDNKVCIPYRILGFKGVY